MDAYILLIKIYSLSVDYTHSKIDCEKQTLQLVSTQLAVITHIEWSIERDTAAMSF